MIENLEHNNQHQNDLQTLETEGPLATQHSEEHKQIIDLPPLNRLANELIQFSSIEEIENQEETKSPPGPQRQSISPESKKKSIVIKNEFPAIENKEIGNKESLKDAKNLPVNIDLKRQSKTLAVHQMNRQVLKAYSKNITLGYSVPLRIKQFIENLKLKTSLWNKEQLKEVEFEIISDLASDTQELYYKKINGGSQKSKFSIITRYLIQLIASIPAQRPTKAKFYVWDIIHIIFIIITLFYVPINIINNNYFYDQYLGIWLNFIRISIIFFVLDILLNFHLGFYHEGNIELNKLKIAKHYLTNGLIYDLITLIPLFNVLVNANNYWNFVNLLILFKIFRLTSIFNKYNELLSTRQYNIMLSLVNLVRLFLTVLFMAHLISITFLGIAKFVIRYQLYENNWMAKYNTQLLEYDWITQYLYAFYWASTMMITVGFGDITPSNPIEVIFVILTMYIGCWIFAYNISSVQMIVHEMRKREIEFSKEMKVVNKYLEVREVESDVRLEVRKYLQHRFQQQNEITKAEEETVFNKLSIGMKEKIIISAYYRFLDGCQFFSKNFSPEFLKRLTLITKQQTFCHNEIIFTETDPVPEDEENYIYIVQKGIIQIYTAYSTEEICVMKELLPGQYFGEIGFLLNQQRTASAKSSGMSQLLMISKKDFLATIKLFQNDFENYCMIRDHTMVNKNNFYLRLQCYICGKANHTAMYCPKVHFIPDQEKVLLKEIYYQLDQKDRQKSFIRKAQRHLNSLKNQMSNMQASKSIREAYMYIYYNENHLNDEDQQFNRRGSAIEQPSQDEIDDEEEDEIDQFNNNEDQLQQQTSQQGSQSASEDTQKKRLSVLQIQKQVQANKGLLSPFFSINIKDGKPNRKDSIPLPQEIQNQNNYPAANSVNTNFPSIIITQTEPPLSTKEVEEGENQQEKTKEIAQPSIVQRSNKKKGHNTIKLDNNNDSASSLDAKPNKNQPLQQQQISVPADNISQGFSIQNLDIIPENPANSSEEAKHAPLQAKFWTKGRSSRPSILKQQTLNNLSTNNSQLLLPFSNNPLQAEGYQLQGGINQMQQYQQQLQLQSQQLLQIQQQQFSQQQLIYPNNQLQQIQQQPYLQQQTPQAQPESQQSLVQITFPSNQFEKFYNFKGYYIHHNLSSILAQIKMQSKTVKLIRPIQYHLFIQEIRTKNLELIRKYDTSPNQPQFNRKKTIKNTMPTSKVITANTLLMRLQKEPQRKSVIKMEKTEDPGDSNKNKLFIFKKIECPTSPPKQEQKNKFNQQ